MESHRLGAAAAAGRIPPSPGHLGASHPPPLHSGKYLPSAINLHPHHSDAFPANSAPFLSGYPGPSPLTSDPTYRSANPSGLQMAQLWASHAHEGYPPLPSSLYSSPYLSLGHLETSSLSQHPLYDPHKDGYFLQSSMRQSPLHPPSASSSTPSSSTPPQRPSRDGGRDRSHRGEREKERDREQLREELRPRSVVDLTQEGRSDEDRRASRDRDRERDRDADRERDRDGWSFHPHQLRSQPSTGEPRSRFSPRQTTVPPGGGGGEGRFLGPEKDRRGRDEDGNTQSHHNQNSNNSHSDRQRRNESVSTSAGTLHVSYVPPPPPLQPSSSGLPHLSGPRESTREQRVSATTYVPSVEVYDERVGPIQIASQARDIRHRERELERDRDSFRFQEKNLVEHPRLSLTGDVGNQREEGSVICSSGSFSKRGPDTSSSSSQSRFSPEARDASKHLIRVEQMGAEPKWNAISPLANFATNHMAALAAQHGHTLSSPHNQHVQKSSSPQTSHRPNSSQSSPHTHPSQHGRAGEEGGQKRYLDQPVLYRPGGSLMASGERGSDPPEVSAMQSLIKYSGNFPAEGPVSSRNIVDGRGPFGGLANIGTNSERDKERNRDREKVSVVGSGSTRMPPQLKREQERPDSARSFGREGDGEVRHPPVGIAVAVARQRDSGSRDKQTGGGSDSQRPLLQTTIKDEERGEDRPRHHDDRLLAGRLEREDKVMRESKGLSEFPTMHPAPLSGGLTPSMMTPSLMNPNLMVTGGAGRWPPDPSTLTSHPWMARSGAPSVWLSSSPYGLGPSSIHQPLPPGYPPSLPGSMHPPYQFVRDPQTSQLIVIPSEHLPHYGGDVLERGAPVWSGVYGTSSSLQHAAQLQLLSQHQMIRQQELFMIQQHTAQVLELQRNAQLVERLKASEHRPEIEDKADKRNADTKTRPSSISSPSPVLHPRKPPPPSRSPTLSTSSLALLPPVSSPVTALKSEGGQRGLSRSPKPLSLHPPSPRSASPPPRRPKQEVAEDEEVVRREEQKPAPAPFPGIFSDLPPGYPYQSVTAPYGSPFPPYRIPPPATGDHSCSPPPAAPLPTAHRRSRLLGEHAKPQKPEPSKNASFLKQEPVEDPPQPDEMPEPRGSRLQSCSPDLTGRGVVDVARRVPKVQTQPLPLLVPSPHTQQGQEDIRKEPEEGGPVKTEVSSCSCPASSPACAGAESKPRLLQEPDQYPPATAAAHLESQEQECVSLEEPTSSVCEQPRTPVLSPFHPESSCDPPPYPPPIHLSPLLLAVGPEDPMGGMFALITASEMARPRTPPAPTLLPQVELPPVCTDCSDAGDLEMVALEGMALLSQMGPHEAKQTQEEDLTLEGLDFLLEASRQVLLEAIEEQSHIHLLRTLDPNRKYSWRQRKEEPLYSKMSVEMLDAVEVEYRVQLAELQKTFKEKQRELSRLQRRRDKRERQQDDERRSLTRRGRGRPRKRKHLTTPPKLDSRPGKASRAVQYSEDSEAGEGQRKRFRVSRGEDEMETGSAGLKKRKNKKSWNDQESPSSHCLEMLKVKRGLVCEQEQLASDLDRALSLSRLGSLGGTRKLSSSRKTEKSSKGAESGPKEQGVHSPVKGGKLKMGAKASAPEAVRKVKGQKKAAMFSPVRSELNSCSNNSDSEEIISARGGWPPLSGTRSHGSLTRKRRSTSSPTLLRPDKKSQKKKHKHLSRLLEEAGLSSSDDSFDQESSDDEEDESGSEDDNSDDDEDGCEESGLGLLARFAASALPASPAPLSLLCEGKPCSRQSTLGSPECEWSDSGSDLRLRKFPSLLHGKRAAPELPLLPPVTSRVDQPSPIKRDKAPPGKDKPLAKARPSPRSARRFSFDIAAGVGGFSEDEGWNRRRSERIFLHDATTSQMPVSASSSASQSSSSSAPPLTPKTPSRPKPTPPSREKKKLKDSPLPVSPSSLCSPIGEGPAPLSLSPARKSQSKPRCKTRELSRGAVTKCLRLSLLKTRALPLASTPHPKLTSAPRSDEKLW
uniref:Trinucleotide repeat containing 18 n=1 Tax=Nothobranchius furzeri TaxID=105023 RepID=A0A1A8VAS8_NOTFU